ncbi:MAG: hypothetical protein JSW27_05025, partial [Phycisphaerales bacterium]
RRHDLHGRQVGVGTILSAALYERLFALENPELVALPEAVDTDFWKTPALTAAVRQQYEAKKPAVAAVRRKLATPVSWHRLRSRLAPAAKPAETIRQWLRRAAGATTAEEIGCTRETLRAATLHMHEIRKRFTVVDLAWMAGILPEAADDIIDQWLS